MRHQETTCYCPAYAFPHRYGGGRCSGARYICAFCFGPCAPRQTDVGIGAYECHGACGTHHEWIVESTCCEAEVLELPRGLVIESLTDLGL